MQSIHLKLHLTYQDVDEKIGTGNTENIKAHREDKIKNGFSSVSVISERSKSNQPNALEEGACEVLTYE